MLCLFSLKSEQREWFIAYAYIFPEFQLWHLRQIWMKMYFLHASPSRLVWNVYAFFSQKCSQFSLHSHFEKYLHKLTRSVGSVNAKCIKFSFSLCNRNNLFWATLKLPHEIFSNQVSANVSLLVTQCAVLRSRRSWQANLKPQNRATTSSSELILFLTTAKIILNTRRETCF